MSIQKRIVHGHNVLELAHLHATSQYPAGRRCYHCDGPVNRYQEAAICCRCEDKGLPMPEAEVAPRPPEPVVERQMGDAFWPNMHKDALREALTEHFGNMAAAARYLGLEAEGLYNYTGKNCFRERWRALPQKHVDRLNAYVRGEVK
jgi:transcriptional regulator with GAF, ATPase, and Fis domain